MNKTTTSIAAQSVTITRVILEEEKESTGVRTMQLLTLNGERSTEPFPTRETPDNYKFWAIATIYSPSGSMLETICKAEHERILDIIAFGEEMQDRYEASIDQQIG